MIDAATIAQRIAAGRPVFERRAEIRGVLRLPTEVSAVVSIRDSIFLAPVVADSTDFHGLVDLSNSRFRGGLDLVDGRFEGPLVCARARIASGRPARLRFAVFNGPAIFVAARFGGPVSFADAQFNSESRFAKAIFSRSADFRFAGFDHNADFAATSFARAASFAGDEFRDTSDFSGADFSSAISFNHARFAGPTDFTTAMFLPSDPTTPPASFQLAHFDNGGLFSQATFASGAVFDRAEAAQEIDFEHATFVKIAYFRLARFFANADFGQADFHGLVNFDEAELTRLDLDGVSLADSHVFLPKPGGGGRLDALRMDPSQVPYVSVGKGKQVGSAREQALALIESAARSGGDLHVAAEAGVRRLTLARNNEILPVRLLDWLFYWQVAGYFLRPLHPLIAIVALIIAFALVRSIIAFAHNKRSRWRSRLAGFLKDLRESAAALWRGGKQNAITRTEAILQKALVAVLLLSLGNVWPPVAGILKGVLP